MHVMLLLLLIFSSFCYAGDAQPQTRVISAEMQQKFMAAMARTMYTARAMQEERARHKQETIDAGIKSIVWRGTKNAACLKCSALCSEIRSDLCCFGYRSACCPCADSQTAEQSAALYLKKHVLELNGLSLYQHSYCDDIYRKTEIRITQPESDLQGCGMTWAGLLTCGSVAGFLLGDCAAGLACGTCASIACGVPAGRVCSYCSLDIETLDDELKKD